MRLVIARLLLFSTLVGSLFAVTGCKTTGEYVRWYDGQPMGTNEIALLSIRHGAGFPVLRVDEIDGQLLTKGKHLGNDTLEIELLPGYHGLAVSYWDSQGNHSTKDKVIIFDAEAGKAYELRGAPLERSFWQNVLAEFNPPALVLDLLDN